MILNFITIAAGFVPAPPAILYIDKGMDSIDELTDREEDFIDRAMNPRLTSRLGCQSLLLDGDGEIEITLPDQTQFLGE